MAYYRNKGAGWYRLDGTRINRGDIFEPTYDELQSRRHKLVKVSGRDPEAPEVAATEQAPEPVDPKAYLDQFATGGNWYDIPGVGKVQGRARALEALGVTDAGTD